MRTSLLCGLLLLTGWTTPARADGLIFQLPADGTAALYETESMPVDGDPQRKNTGTVSVASVGKLEVDGEPCRWIELKLSSRRDGQERLSVTKLLIPEKFIKKGESAADHVIRGWTKQGDNEPRPIENSSGASRMFEAYFFGPAPNALELDAIETDGKLGKLMCKGVSGDHELTRENRTVKIHYEIRLHEKAPFGVVSGTWKFERMVNGQAMGGRTTRLTLVDVNPTALSEMPDRN